MKKFIKTIALCVALTLGVMGIGACDSKATASGKVNYIQNGANSVKSDVSARRAEQTTIFSDFPTNPKNYEYFDWKERSSSYYNFIYDIDKDSRYPTIVKSTQNINSNAEKYNISDYYGDARFAEFAKFGAFTNVAGTLGATLAGLDVTNITISKENDKSLDFLKMLDEVYNPELKVIVEDPRTPEFSNWWFDLLSNMMYFQIADRYADYDGINLKLKGIADSHYDMVEALGGESVNFDYDGFNFVSMKPVAQSAGNPFNGSLDGGFSAALIEFWAYKMFNEEKYLNAAKWCMDWYEKSREVRFFDNHTAYAPYLAARMNAECGTQYSVEKFINWTKESNMANIGAITSSEGGFDFYGLSGYHNSYGQKERAYLYESAQYSYFVPAVKYDLTLANDIGRYMLNLSSNARFFYADMQPASNQLHGATYRETDERFIAYESLEVLSKEGKANYAEGDPSRWRKVLDVYPDSQPMYKELVEVMGPCTDLGFYGSNWSAMIGAVVDNTNVERVLQLDLNALDFYADKTYPAYLYYNPHDTEKTVEIKVDAASDLFDSLSDGYAAKNVTGTASFTIPASSSRVIYVVPTGAEKKYDGRKTVIGDRVVAYANIDDLSLSYGCNAVTPKGDEVALTDGLYYTEWSSETAAQQSITVDLGRLEDINTIEVIWGKDFATKYKAEYSADGDSYSILFDNLSASASGLDKNYLSALTVPKKARYVKLTLLESSGTKYDIQAFKISRWFETDGVNLAMKKDIECNSEDNNPEYGHLVKIANMNDGVKGTRWAGRALKEDGKDIYVIIDLGKEYLVNQVAISWSSSYAKEYNISVSSDKAAFTNVKTVNNGGGGLENNNFDSVLCRYVKLEMTKGTPINNVVYPYSINEIEIYFNF